MQFLLIHFYLLKHKYKDLYTSRRMLSNYQKQLTMYKLKYDFMGYEFKNSKELSFHHLIIPKKDCKDLGFGSGYLFWNGAILVQKTSHDYLHIVERIDRDRFNYITCQMIDENIANMIMYENLKKINDCLEGFEKEHCGHYNKKHPKDPLIKEAYTRRLIKK